MITTINNQPVSILSIDDLFALFGVDMSELGPSRNQAKAEAIEQAMRTGYDQCKAYCELRPDKTEKAIADHNTAMIALAEELAELSNCRECRSCKKYFYPDVPRHHYCIECWEESE